MTSYNLLWIDRHETDPRSGRKKRPATTVAAAAISPSTPSTAPKKAKSTSDSSLNPQSGKLRCRLDHVTLFHCPVEPESVADQNQEAQAEENHPVASIDGQLASSTERGLSNVMLARSIFVLPVSKASTLLLISSHKKKMLQQK